MAGGPVRSCVGCGAKRPQQELIRVARRADGLLEVDSSGRVPGRGAYVCPASGCIEVALRGSLKRALKFDGALPEKVGSALEAQVNKGD